MLVLAFQPYPILVTFPVVFDRAFFINKLDEMFGQSTHMFFFRIFLAVFSVFYPLFLGSVYEFTSIAAPLWLAILNFPDLIFGFDLTPDSRIKLTPSWVLILCSRYVALSYFKVGFLYFGCFYVFIIFFWHR